MYASCYAAFISTRVEQRCEILAQLKSIALNGKRHDAACRDEFIPFPTGRAVSSSEKDVMYSANILSCDIFKYTLNLLDNLGHSVGVRNMQPNLKAE